MKKAILVITLAAAFSGCDSGSGNIKRAEIALSKMVNDPSSLQLRTTVQYDQGNVCGTMNAKNKLGGYGDPKPFVFVASEEVTVVSGHDEFAELAVTHCENWDPITEQSVVAVLPDVAKAVRCGSMLSNKSSDWVDGRIVESYTLWTTARSAAMYYVEVHSARLGYQDDAFFYKYQEEITKLSESIDTEKECSIWDLRESPFHFDP